MKIAHGDVKGDTWTKMVLGSVHQLRKPQAWAMDISDLEAAERMGAKFVCIYDREKLVRWWAAIETIRSKGFKFQRGHGLQVGLGLLEWKPTKQAAAVKPDNMYEERLV